MNEAQKNQTFSLDREFFSEIDKVDSVCGEIRDLLREKGWDSIAFAAELITHECLNNAVLHGNGGDSGKRVVMHLLCSRKQIRLQVTDEGPGFPWRQSEGTTEAELEATSGRGMSIIRAYADRVRFNRRGNQITLWLSEQSPKQQEQL